MPGDVIERRVELLRELRMGEYDVLIGINLLREGLDLPEVSLVSILDADKEGFLEVFLGFRLYGKVLPAFRGGLHEKVRQKNETAIHTTYRKTQESKGGL